MDTYDPKVYNISYGGISLNAGIADGTFITVTRTNRTMSLNGGADGGQTAVVSNNRSCTLTLTLRAGSRTNTRLTILQSKQDGSPGIYEIGTMSVTDYDGGSEVVDQSAMIDGPPDFELGTDEPNRVWTFLLPKPTIKVRGSLAPPRVGSVLLDA